MKTNIEIKNIAKDTISQEIKAIENLKNFINDDFVKVVQLIFSSKGRVIITGIGKSANIATKIVSTLNSTGTPSLFMHAAEAIHGDLGMVQKDDIVICISKSGETALINDKAKKAKLHNIPIISFTQGGKNTLSAMSDFPFIVNDQNHYDWNNIQTSQFYPMLLFYLEYFVEKNF